MLIRGAMMAGVLVFGLAAWHSGRSNTQHPVGREVARPLAVAWYAVLLVSAGAVVSLRNGQAGRRTFQERARRCLAGWGVSGVSPFLGGVYLLLTRDPMLYALGLVALGAAFRLLEAGARDG